MYYARPKFVYLLEVIENFFALTVALTYEISATVSEKFLETQQV